MPIFDFTPIHWGRRINVSTLRTSHGGTRCHCSYPASRSLCLLSLSGNRSSQHALSPLVPPACRVGGRDPEVRLTPGLFSCMGPLCGTLSPLALDVNAHLVTIYDFVQSFSLMNRRTALRGAFSVISVSGHEQSVFGAIAGVSSQAFSSLLSTLPSPVLFAGDSTNAYRDPAAIYHNGWFYLYFTWIRTEQDGVPYSYVAWSRSRDLRDWTGPAIITARDKNLDFGSPGDVVRYRGRWVICLQTYPRPHGERYGNQQSRVWTMSSQDLQHWSKPEILRVKELMFQLRRWGE